MVDDILNVFKAVITFRFGGFVTPCFVSSYVYDQIIGYGSANLPDFYCVVF